MMGTRVQTALPRVLLGDGTRGGKRQGAIQEGEGTD
jgi:hypothetical protein